MYFLQRKDDIKRDCVLYLESRLVWSCTYSDFTVDALLSVMTQVTKSAYLERVSTPMDVNKLDIYIDTCEVVNDSVLFTISVSEVIRKSFFFRLDAEDNLLADVLRAILAEETEPCELEEEVNEYEGVYMFTKPQVVFKTLMVAPSSGFSYALYYRVGDSAYAYVNADRACYCERSLGKPGDVLKDHIAREISKDIPIGASRDDISTVIEVSNLITDPTKESAVVKMQVKVDCFVMGRLVRTLYYSAEFDGVTIR